MQEMVNDLLLIRQIGDILMTVFPNTFEECLCLHSFDPILSCRVDIGEDEDIRIVKSSQKIMKKGLGSGITMGLKNGNDPSLPTGPAALSVAMISTG